MVLRGEDLALLEQIAAPVRQFDGYPARQCQIAFEIQQALAGRVGGHQRGGTGCLDADGRARQVEDIRAAGSQKILVVARMAQQKQALGGHQFRVRQQIEGEIGAHAAAGEDPDRALHPFRRVA